MLRPLNKEGNIIKLQNYRYICHDLIFAIPGETEPITVPSNLIKTVYIVKKYDTAIIPYVYIMMQIDRDMYQKVQTNMNNLTVAMSIDRYIYEDGEIKFPMNMIKGTFKAMNKELLDSTVAGKLKDTENSNGYTTQAYIDMGIYLYDNELLSKYYKMQSMNLIGTFNDAIYHTFQPRGFKNVLLSRLTDTSIKNYIYEYGHLGQNIDFLNSLYGLYDTPYTFFMDFDCTYLISRNNLGRTLRDMELGNVNIYLEDYSDGNLMDTGCYIDNDNGFYILNLNVPPTIVDIDDNIEYLEYSRLHSIVTGQLSIQDQNIGSRGVDKAISVNNNKIPNQENFRTSETKRHITVEFADINNDIISPNKQYSIIPTNTYNEHYSVKGNYRISECLITLITEGDSDMKSVTTITLYKQ